MSKKKFVGRNTKPKLNLDPTLEEGSAPKQGRIRVSRPEARTVDGIVFASVLESKFYTILKQQIPEGELHLQPAFLLQDSFRDVDGKAIRTITYQADFLLGPKRDNNTDPVLPENVVIDAKGHMTDIFRLKAKLFLYRYKTRLVLVKTVKQLQTVIDNYLQAR